ncbi:DUF3253 domain-containing protein [uncultured Sulfitobacter sp.]|uniref:DUF3253 domain-containing protein n=1 Tax=uncultured Sulfitobacter sp. TaxID=191468 RepID=UPI0034458543
MSARTAMMRSAGAVTQPSEAMIKTEITRQVIARGAGKTICPSEVARALAQDWRVLMPEIRAVADRMAAQGKVVITQKGQPIVAAEARGPIRLGLAHQSD